MPELEDKDYREMWERLMAEFIDLESRGLLSISPILVLNYMGFIDRAVHNEQQISLMKQAAGGS